jgi:CCS family citrate carrier protein
MKSTTRMKYDRPIVRRNLSWLSGVRLLADFRIGIIPLPVYVVLLALMARFSLTGQINGEINMMIAALALGGFTCAAIGMHIPILRNIGGAALVTIFLPSFLVDAHLLPALFVQNVTTFTNSTNFIYLYIAAIVVGSILSMDRERMVQSFIKIFAPLAAGSVVAIIVGTTVGWLGGLGAWRSLFFVVIPVMAGGVGEGAIPLSIGYSEILGQNQGQVLAQLLPLAFFGNLTAILISGVLNNIGKRHPHLTGNGTLQPGTGNEIAAAAQQRPSIAHSNVRTIDVGTVAAAGMTAITIYLLGVMLHSLVGLPAPVGMLIIVVILKLVNVVPAEIEEGSRVLFRFFVTAVTYPLLFAVAVALTPWRELVSAFHPANLITVIATVSSLSATGYFVGRWLKMYPVDAAIVNATHSGLGGTGDVMILTAAERMELMPFAQVATRIGGAITITLALIALSRFKPF